MRERNVVQLVVGTPELRPTGRTAGQLDGARDGRLSAVHGGQIFVAERRVIFIHVDRVQRQERLHGVSPQGNDHVLATNVQLQGPGRPERHQVRRH